MHNIDSHEIEMDGDIHQATNNNISPEKASRQKILYSICIYGAFLMIGWNRGLFGPSFPDIQHICQVNLESGSWIPTAFFIGYFFGALTSGLLEKFDRKLTFGISLVILAVSVAVTPWCVVFGVMIVAQLVQGFCQGIVDTILTRLTEKNAPSLSPITIVLVAIHCKVFSNSEILLTWTNRRLMFFCLELMYCIGDFTSPLVASSFLMDIPITMKIPMNVTTKPYLPFFNNISFNNSVLNRLQNVYGDRTNTTVVFPLTTPPSPEAFKAMIYIPYSITAFLMMCISIAFLVLYFVYKKENNTYTVKKIEIKEPEDDSEPSAIKKEMKEPEVELKSERNPRKHPAKIKGCCLATASGFSLFFLGIYDSFDLYLTVFCVNNLQLTPADGALITSVINTCGIVSIVVSLFINCNNTLVYAGVNCTFVFLSFVGVLISSIYYYGIGMWIACGAYGFFRSMVFSLLFTWVNEYITPVTAKVSSLFMISFCLGAAFNPVMLGNIMEKFGDIWMCYAFVVEGFIVLLLYFVLMGFTWYVVKHFGKTFNKTQKNKTTKVMTETFIQEGDKDNGISM